jgi:hypothetical protein
MNLSIVARNLKYPSDSLWGMDSNEPPLFVVFRNVLIVCMFIHARRKTFSMGMHRSETFCHAFVMHPHTHSAHSSSACASTVFTASSCKSGG